MMSFESPLPADAVGAVAAVTGLSVAFAVKHYLADFLFQTNWMARGKEGRAGWRRPLLAHCLCHAVLTLAILIVAAPRLWWLALLDLSIHLAADRGKSLIGQQGAWAPDKPQFWWLLGLDQLVHQLTNVGLATTIVLLRS